MTIRIIDYHRNGICGLGFHVAVVEHEGREMLVIRFEDADKPTGSVVCAAFDFAQLDKREVRFFYNSWRGDHYAQAMDDAARDFKRPKGFYDVASPGFDRNKKFIQPDPQP